MVLTLCWLAVKYIAVLLALLIFGIVVVEKATYPRRLHKEKSRKLINRIIKNYF